MPFFFRSEYGGLFLGVWIARVCLFACEQELDGVRVVLYNGYAYCDLTGAAALVVLTDCHCYSCSCFYLTELDYRWRLYCPCLLLLFLTEADYCALVLLLLVLLQRVHVVNTLAYTACSARR